ncbi:MAG: conserved phage C-terminal domain-containing protein [Lachnospiraceae bacterium]|nr:conserved phage C-terminal domain-containing protein [Lachnospiraceae bacterium]
MDSKETTEVAHAVIDYLNEVTGSRYRYSESSLISIKARLKEGFTLQDFKNVIYKKSSQWINDPEMCKYLRPETLFCTKHFESYLNEKFVDNKTEDWRIF